MNKLVSTLILSAFAALSFNAVAASHAGGAPMAKASAPAAKASEPAKAPAKAAAPAAKASEPMKK